MSSNPPNHKKCCYCHNVAAIGRVEFLNANYKVVDNPFCFYHQEKVMERTEETLKVFHSDENYRLCQVRYTPPFEPLPSLAATVEEFLSDLSANV